MYENVTATTSPIWELPNPDNGWITRSTMRVVHFQHVDVASCLREAAQYLDAHDVGHLVVDLSHVFDADAPFDRSNIVTVTLED